MGGIQDFRREGYIASNVGKRWTLKAITSGAYMG
jgi:hypothetical protein